MGPAAAAAAAAGHSRHAAAWHQQPPTLAAPAARCGCARVPAALLMSRPTPAPPAPAVPQAYGGGASRSSSSSRPHHQQHQHRQQRNLGTPGPRSPHRAVDYRGVRDMSLPQLQDLLQQAPPLPASALAAVLSRLAKLRPQDRHERRQARQLATHACELLRPCVGSIVKGHELATLLWALAKLGAVEDAGLYSATLELLLAPPTLQSLEPRHLSNIVYAGALAAAGDSSSGSPAAVPDVLRCVLPQLLQPQTLAAANPQDVSCVLWAFGTHGPDTLQHALTQPQLDAALSQLLGQLESQLHSAAPQAVSNTLWALAKLSHEPQQHLLLALLQQLLAQAARASSQDASSSLWALASLQLPAQLLLSKGDATATQRQQQQGLDAASSLRSSILQLLRVVAAPGAGRSNSHSLALGLWAAAKLRVQPPQPLLQQLLSAFMGNLQRAAPQDVANLTWACATIHTQQQAGHDPLAGSGSQHQQAAAVAPLLQQAQADALLGVLVASAAARTHPQGIANTLWAVAKLGLAVQLRHCKPLVAAFADHAAAGAALPQNAANVLWALAMLQEAATASSTSGTHQQQQWEPVPAGVVGMLLDALVQQASSASVQDVANALSAAAKLGYCAPHSQLELLVEHVVQAVAAAGGGDDPAHTSARQQQQQPVKPQEAANILWAAATMQQLHKQQRQHGQQQQFPQLRFPQVQLLLSVVADALPHGLGEAELCTALWAAAKLEPCVVAEGLLTTQEAQASLARTIPSLSLQGLSNVAFALGQLGVVEARGQLLPLLLHQGAQQAQQLSGQHDGSRAAQALGMLCWSAAVLMAAPVAARLQPLAAQFSQQWSHFAPEGLSQVFMLHLALQQQQQQQATAGASSSSRQPGPPGLSGCLTEPQLQQCREAWLRHQGGGGLLAAAAATGSGFRLQRKVLAAARQLEGLAGPPVLEALTDDGLFSIDILAETAAGARLAIEVDGPSHHRLPDRRPTGTTLFRDTQLAARGYVVVPVAHFAWNAAVAAAGISQHQQDAAAAEEAEGAAGAPFLQQLVQAALASSVAAQPEAPRASPAAAPFKVSGAAQPAAIEAAGASVGSDTQAAAPQARRRRRALTSK